MTHPLAGRRVVVTRPADQGQELCQRLLAMGAEPISFPVIAIVPAEPGSPLDRAIGRLAEYDWIIFTSVNGVEQFWARLADLRSPADDDRQAGLPFAGKVAAIGPKTAEALRSRGAGVHLMPDEFRAEAILDEIGAVKGQHILLPRADIARPALAEGLHAMGARVDEVTAYRTIRGQPPRIAFDALRAGVDIVTFTSSSTVRNFVVLTEDLDYGDPLIVCIGPVTASTARELGLRVDVVAKEYTIEGLLEALERTLNEPYSSTGI
jgi:uroporphyrinogen-III synthase